MKQLFFPVLISMVVIILPTCSNLAQEDAKKTAEKIKSTVKASAGAVATSPNGYYMKAKINGKEWVASHMLPYDMINNVKRVVGEKGDEYIGLPYNQQWDKIGKKESLAKMK